MAAFDNYVLEAEYQVPLTGNDATLSVVNLNLGITITVYAHHRTFGSETYVLSQSGATVVLPLAGVDEVTISATSYPATILFIQSAVPATLSTPQSFAGASGGGATVNVEAVGYSGSVKTTVVTVGTSPTPLPASILANRRSVSVQAPSTNSATVYVGGSGVTADTTATGGLEIAAGGSFADQLGGAILYGIVASGTQSLIVYEVS